MTVKTELMTSGEAARTLKISVESVRAYDRKGILKAMKTVGGKRIFLKSQVEKLAAERNEKSA